MILPTLLERLLRRLHLLPVPILDAFGGVLFGRALAISVRRGLFEHLSEDPCTSSELAIKIGLNQRSTQLLLEAFEVAGYLHERKGSYRLSADAERWLVKRSPHYLGNLIAYFETLYGRWGYLEHSLEQGAPPRAYFEGFTDEDWRVYVYGMRDLARIMIPHVHPKLRLHPDATRILDLGGSHGLYAVGLCRTYPNIRATIVDFPGALRHATRFIESDHLTQRIDLLEADFIKSSLPGKQDGILLFNVIHGFTEPENSDLICRALEALSPGGKIFILDQFRESGGGSKLSRFIPLMVGLNLLNETGGTTYSVEQIKEWCGSAVAVRYHRLHLPGIGLVELRN